MSRTVAAVSVLITPAQRWAARRGSASFRPGSEWKVVTPGRKPARNFGRGGSDRMEALELETVILAMTLVVAAIALPVGAIALHQHKRRAYERAAGLRRKEKIRL